MTSWPNVVSVTVSQPTSIFVYGSLMTGETAESIWPMKPNRIETACVEGWLFDLGNYPGLILRDTAAAVPELRGEPPQRVRGELWTFDVDDLPTVFAVLDEYEAADALAQPRLYRRVDTALCDRAGQPRAHVYEYLPELLAETSIKRVAACEPHVVHECVDWRQRRRP